MTTDIATAVRNIDPERTVLLFGAGSSIPSGAPSVKALQDHLFKAFGVESGDYTLAEQTGIIEGRIRDRSRLISELRTQFKTLRPTGSLLNLPLFKWKSIYTTNFDELIEDCYSRRGAALNIYTCNFDFHIRSNPASVQLFKLHGTIQKDECFGDKSRLILTQADYDLTEKYREQLYDRLKGDLAGAHLVIIGHSLADPDIRQIIDRTLSLRTASGAATKITLFLYTRDQGRAELFEARGMEVCFGGIDDFFSGLIPKIVTSAAPSPPTGDPLDIVHQLRPSTLDVSHALGQIANATGMFNGWPVSYPDIRAGLSFQRNIATKILAQLTADDKPIAVLLGASGVGKTREVAGFVETAFRPR